MKRLLIKKQLLCILLLFVVAGLTSCAEFMQGLAQGTQMASGLLYQQMMSNQGSGGGSAYSPEQYAASLYSSSPSVLNTSIDPKNNPNPVSIPGVQVSKDGTSGNYGNYIDLYTDDGASSGSSSGSSGKGKSSKSSSSSRTKCSHCKGTGDDVYSTGMGGYGVKSTKYCSICRKDVAMDHAHRTCPYCNGTGYK